jgi:hypothetical protein
MSKQYHFVVVYDGETGEFDVDYETQDVRFHDGPIYDTDQDSWTRIGDELFDDNSPYNRSADALYRAMRELKAGE